VIVRVLRAKVRADRVSAFNAILRQQVTLLREQPGLLYVNLARRLKPDGGQDAILFEEWHDADSLYAWVGPNLAEPRLVPGARQLMDDLVVAHYECLVDDATETGPPGRPEPVVQDAPAKDSTAQDVGASGTVASA
jgi:hypothetical protein